MAFGGALENLAEADDPRIIQAARGRGLMRFRLGRHEDALKDLRDARARAHAHGPADAEIDLLLDEATVLDWTKEFSLSADLVGAAESLATAPSPLIAARIKLGHARTHYRQLDPRACADLGTQAAHMAESLGDPGYETMVIALLMTTASYAILGQLDEAEQASDKVLRTAESRGDMQHLAGILNNRVFLWFARKDIDRLLAELTTAVKISREIGAPLMEYNAVQNMAEAEYVVEALDQATEHAQRALELTTQLWGEQSAEMSVRELLLGRVALYRGDHAETGRIANGIHARSASTAGAEGSELGPSDKMMLEVLELGIREATEEEWDELVERALALGLQPHEDVEILEASALASARAGRLDAAKIRLESALQLCAAKPNLISKRVERRYAAMFGARSAAAPS
jgi:tetratricopeptide (TPR) repeat protein